MPKETRDEEGYFPVKTISFSKDVPGLDIDLRNYSGGGEFYETDSVIGGDLGRRCQGGKVIVSDYLAWCLIERISSQRPR